MSKLSWNPPKWKSYDFDGDNFKVELENGEVFKGNIWINHIKLYDHCTNCVKIFGTELCGNKNSTKISELSQILDLNLNTGYWPECSDVKEFIKKYYERVAKIKNSNTFKIYIETEFNITPKFTI